MPGASLEGFRLSPQQRHLWLLQQADQSFLRTAQCAVLLEGKLNKEQLVAALREVIDHHEILRTTYGSLPGMAIPVQVLQDGSTCWQHEERTIDQAYFQDQQALKELFWATDQASLHMQDTSVIHTLLLQASDEQHLLHITLPAINADVTSLYNLMAAISHRYHLVSHEDEANGEVVQYADIAELLNELAESEQGLEVSRKYVDQWMASQATPLPFQREGEVSDLCELASLQMRIDPATLANLLDSTQQSHALIPHMLLVCWSILIARLVGTSDCVIGVTSHGRTYEELDTAIGLFAKDIPCHISLPEGSRFNLVLAEVAQALLELEELQDYFSWERVEGVHQYAEILPFCPYGFEWRDRDTARLAGDVTFSMLSCRSYRDRFQVKLVCEYQEDALTIAFQYNPRVLLAGDIERLAEEFATLLQSAAKTPHAFIDELQAIGVREYEHQVTFLNRTTVEYMEPFFVQKIFEAQARLTPDAIAVISGEEHFTYRELNEQANQLAHYLQIEGICPDGRVALYLERSFKLIVGLLGVLKAGGTCVLLDPFAPKERLAFIFRDSAALVILMSKRFLDQSPAVDARIICLESDEEIIKRQALTNLETPLFADNLAYIIYTSGSTGTPKGVMIPHRGLSNYLKWSMQAYPLQHGCGSLVHSSVGFDLTITSLFPPLLAGRSVVLLPEREVLESQTVALRDYHHFSLIKVTPAHLQILNSELSAEQAASLTHAFVIGGEALSANHLRFWRTQAPHTRLINEYGPTETVVGCCTYEISANTPSSGDIPIGYPIANTQLYILDRSMHLSPYGSIGELYISGAGLARGYHSNPELTATRFIPHPFSSIPGARLYRTGDLVRYTPTHGIEYIGRADNQVKIRGFRVELDEISSVLKAHPSVKEAVTILRETETSKYLVAYAVPEGPDTFPVQQLLRLKTEKLLTGHITYELPNGMEIVQKNIGETEYLYQEIFAEQRYFKHHIFLKEGASVVDVGANIGMFTLFVGQSVRGAHIYAFEPVPPLFEILKLNVALYDINATLFNCGLSARSGASEFTYYPHLSLMSGRYANQAEEYEIVKSFEYRKHDKKASEEGDWPEELVDELLNEYLISEHFLGQTTTLSEIISQYHIEEIDLLKIDAEKSEQDILVGIKEDDWQKIKQLVIEVHDVDGRLQQTLTLLEQHGFTCMIEQEAVLKGTCLYLVYGVQNKMNLQTVDKQLGRRGNSLWPKYSSQRALIQDIQHLLGKRLPDYMLPAKIVLLDIMPLTSHGKIDRQKLPFLEEVSNSEQRAHHIAPRSSVEEILAYFWLDVLGLEHISIHDNFFALGGHSLLATRLISQIRTTFNLNVSVRSLFDAPTVASFAAFLLTMTEDRTEIEKIAIAFNTMIKLSDREIDDLAKTAELSGWED